ncbi:hypothetical protein M0804_002707 [Polistes exclamans]|nr:hypothetical protein M0804_002707 [Polistes exclamans]
MLQVLSCAIVLMLVLSTLILLHTRPVMVPMGRPKCHLESLQGFQVNCSAGVRLLTNVGLSDLCWYYLATRRPMTTTTTMTTTIPPKLERFTIGIYRRVTTEDK